MSTIQQLLAQYDTRSNGKNAREELLDWHRQRAGERKVSRKRGRSHVVWEKPNKAICVDEAKTNPDVQSAGDAKVVRGDSGSRAMDSGGAGGGHQRQNGGGAGNS
jgi:hypothetical protein